jgi:urease accessory protein
MNLHLLQLVSPSLPVGAYSYSQGLEAAIDAGVVRDAASARDWIGDMLQLSLGAFEAPVFLRLASAWGAGDHARAAEWNALFVASRETSELRAETLQMGYSLRKLLRDLALPRVAALDAFEELAYPTAFTFAVAAWEIDAREALEAHLFGWLENQVLAALKTVPLGQTDGQRMLMALAREVPAVAARAAVLADDELASFTPGLAILSSRHETQYTRIFRS